MTQAKAQAVVSALIGAGYTPAVSIRDTEWVVRVQHPGTPASTVSAFAAAQQVTANVTDVEFS